MAKHLVKALAHHRVRLHSKLSELTVSLKSAIVKDDEYSLDKDKSAFNDLFDSKYVSFSFTFRE